MSHPTKILGVIASLRDSSQTAIVVRSILDQSREFGGEPALLDLRQVNLQLYRPDDEEEDDAYSRTREQVLWADAFILGSPDYHGGMSGAMKNFLDYFWREFAGKLFGYVVASHERGLTAQDQMRTAVRQCYGWSLPYGIGFNGDEALAEDGSIKSDPLARRVRMMARDLVVYGRLLTEQFSSDLTAQPRAPGFAERFKR